MVAWCGCACAVMLLLLQIIMIYHLTRAPNKTQLQFTNRATSDNTYTPPLRISNDTISKRTAHLRVHRIPHARRNVTEHIAGLG